MNKTRREFLMTTGGAISAAAISTVGSHAAGMQDWEKPSNVSRAKEKVDILFLGGTRFVGPHQPNP